MKIGLIGDHIIDTYVYGSVTRISPESPMPIFSQKSIETKYGGAGNVYNNLRAFGVWVEYRRAPDYECSVKTRYIADNFIMFRSDDDKKSQTYLNPVFDQDIKVVVVSDYNKGALDSARSIIGTLITHDKFVIVDPKRKLEHFAGVDIIKLNEKEFTEYSSTTCPIESAKKYTKTALIITRAEKSILVATPQGNLYEVENTASIQVKDVTGAGDVFTAALAFFICSGNSLLNSIRKACELASLSVTKTGTYVLTKDDINSVSGKLVFTNGCFDILHKGHIDYLKKSKALGSKLVVGLNSDASVRRLKGDKRPINNQEDRKYLLEALQFVDEVIIFDEDTPYNLIKRIQPDIITKGGDYNKEDVVGKDVAEVIIIPHVAGYSTTNLITGLS